MFTPPTDPVEGPVGMPTDLYLDKPAGAAPLPRIFSRVVGATVVLRPDGWGWDWTLELTYEDGRPPLGSTGGHSVTRRRAVHRARAALAVTLLAQFPLEVVDRA